MFLLRIFWHAGTTGGMVMTFTTHVSSIRLKGGEGLVFAGSAVMTSLTAVSTKGIKPQHSDKIYFNAHP